jgi:16S rRNA U1498 N3-methylase RsmE
MLEWILQQLVSAGVGVVAGMLIERWRRRWELEKEATREHFAEIKKCLILP